MRPVVRAVSGSARPCYRRSRSSSTLALLVVLVPALAGLTPQRALLVLLGDRLLRLHALVTGFLVAIHPDVVVNVYAGKVHELERTHRMAQGRLARCVYVLKGGHASLVKLDGLVHEGT